MIITEPLEHTLTEPGARELSLDDRRLDEVLSHAGHNRFLQAAEGAQKLWSERLYDVRTIGCYLFGVFLERGVTALPLIFDCIQRALKENFAFLSPSHKKERHLDSSLRWLFDGIVNQARHHERQKDAVWSKWNADWIRPVQQTALESGQRLLGCVEEVLPGLRCRQPLFHLLALIETMATASEERTDWDLSRASVIPAPPPPADEISTPDEDRSDVDDDSPEGDLGSGESDSGDSHRSRGEDGDSDEDESSRADHEQEKEEEQPADEEGESSDHEDPDDADSEPLIAKAEDESATSASATLPVTGDTLTIPIHPKLAALLQAVAGFVSLTRKQRFARAAIVAQHISEQLARVDAAELLPSLFVEYLLALVKHSDKLTPFMSKESDFATETLRRLCRADLTRFLAESER